MGRDQGGEGLHGADPMKNRRIQSTGGHSGAMGTATGGWGREEDGHEGETEKPLRPAPLYTCADRGAVLPLLRAVVPPPDTTQWLGAVLPSPDRQR